MPKTILPVAKKIFVCDDVIGDPASRKTSVLNVWNAIRVHRDDFPCPVSKLCVFAQLHGGVGDISIHIEIVQMGTGKVIRLSDPFMISFEDRSIIFRTRIMLEDVTFPSPGTYLVEMYCNQEFVDDQPVRLIPSS